MKYIREDYIHYLVRKLLRNSGWKLIAGQYPNGSDDELSSLYVVDPTLAKDQSPDHRRHSKNKFVPDLLASKENLILIIEMKPSYSVKDEAKLETLTSVRVDDLKASLKAYNSNRALLKLPIDDYMFIPSLGFSKNSKYTNNDSFCYFLVDKKDRVHFTGNAELPSLT